MTDTTTLMPTHTCFDDALDLLCEFWRERPDIRDDLRLVHAICRLPGGDLFSHAWLEDIATEQVMFVSLLEADRGVFAADRNEWYADIHVQACTLYTLRDALWHNARSGHFGPWEYRYRRLCRDYGGR